MQDLRPMYLRWINFLNPKFMLILLLRIKIVLPALHGRTMRNRFKLLSPKYDLRKKSILLVFI